MLGWIIPREMGSPFTMGQDQAESSKRIEQLCQQLLRETDPDQQAKLTAEIHRIVEESRRLRGDPPSTPGTT